jgi:hypothetical protein
MSFRMVASLPHHLPRLIGFSPANRVDMEDFSQRSALLPADRTARALTGGVQQGLANLTRSSGRLPRGPAGFISGPATAAGEAAAAAGSMDSTLRASTETAPTGESNE